MSQSANCLLYMYVQGGIPGALKFTSTEKLVALLKKQAEAAKPYGAICASPGYVLEPHGLLKVINLCLWVVCDRIFSNLNKFCDC